MLIGLTGGIASGKNLTAGFFKELGAHIIDADEISREIAKPELPAYNAVVQEFGLEILNPDKTINRKKLGKIVFNDKDKLKKLESITHPKIIAEENRQIKNIQLKNPDAVIIVNAALLIETGRYREMDKVIVVYADENTQRKRLMARDGISEVEARMRISQQMPLKEKVKFADFVIDNSFDVEKTKEEVVKVFKTITL